MYSLAAVLSAVMSTISSQLIVTSSALVEDLYKAFNKTPKSDSYYVFLGRLAVFFVSVVAIMLAWPNNESVLSLVSFAWAGFGSAFGPVILLSLYWRRITSQGAIAGLIVGAVVAFVWGKAKWLGLYEIIPGFFLGLLAIVVVSLLTYRPNKEIDETFDAAIAHLKEEMKK